MRITTGAGGVLPSNLDTTSHLHRPAALQPYIWLATTGNASGGCT